MRLLPVERENEESRYVSMSTWDSSLRFQSTSCVNSPYFYTHVSVSSSISLATWGSQ